MTLTTETLFIVVVFLLPGFLANKLTDYYSRAPGRERSAFDSTLASLAISLGILSLQAILASIALSILWLGWRDAFEDLQLNVLVSQGTAAYFEEQPLLFASVLGSSILLSYTVAAVLGVSYFRGCSDRDLAALA